MATRLSQNNAELEADLAELVPHGPPTEAEAQELEQREANARNLAELEELLEAEGNQAPNANQNANQNANVAEPNVETPPTEEEIAAAVEAGINPFNEAQLIEWVRAHRLRQVAPPNNIPTVNPWKPTHKKGKTPFNSAGSNAPVTNAELLAHRMGTGNKTAKNGKKNKKGKKDKKSLLNRFRSRKNKKANLFLKANNGLNADMSSVMRQIEANGKNPWNKTIQKEYLNKSRNAKEVNPFLKANNGLNTDMSNIRDRIEANGKNPWNKTIQKEYLNKTRNVKEVNPFLQTRKANNGLTTDMSTIRDRIEANGKNPWNKAIQKEYLNKTRNAKEVNPFLKANNRIIAVMNQINANTNPLGPTRIQEPRMTVVTTGNNKTLRKPNCPPKGAQNIENTVTRKLNKRIQRVLAAYSFLKDETTKLEQMVSA